MTREPDDEVSFFVRLASTCERLRCLPGPGGVLDQDGYLMMGLQATLDAFAEKRERENKPPRVPAARPH